MHKIFTLGYANLSLEQLREHVESRAALLIDIRYNPWSRRPEFTERALQQQFGATYQHVGCLGNLNYQTDGPIQLVNPTLAVPIIRMYLEHQPVILLCGCRDWQTCHRRTAAEYLSQAIGVEVEHIESSDHHQTKQSLNWEVPA